MDEKDDMNGSDADTEGSGGFARGGSGRGGPRRGGKRGPGRGRGGPRRGGSGRDRKRYDDEVE